VFRVGGFVFCLDFGPKNPVMPFLVQAFKPSCLFFLLAILL